jgi:hypothetical protein
MHGYQKRLPPDDDCSSEKFAEVTDTLPSFKISPLSIQTAFFSRPNNAKESLLQYWTSSWRAVKCDAVLREFDQMI